MMSAKYFEYYTIILRGRFFRGHTVQSRHSRSYQHAPDTVLLCPHVTLNFDL